MLTTGSKLYFGLGALSLFAAIAYGFGSHGGLNGALTGGLSGGVGELTGYVVLLSASAVSFFVGGAIVAFRDADAEQVAQVAGADHVPVVESPGGTSYWPALGAVAAGLVVLGAVINTQLFLLGAIIGGVVLIEWMVAAWADRASGDRAANRRIRNRIMYPLEVPVFGAIGIVALVLSISRVLLALTKTGSAIAAIVLAVVILASATAIAASSKAGRTAVAALCVLAALGVLAGGIISAASGERTFHPHEETGNTTYHAPDRNQPLPSASETGGEATTTTAHK
jgi:hypothetical protein